MALCVVEENRCLNNIVEQCHGRVMLLARPGLNLGNCLSAQRTFADCGVMALIKKGQVQGTGGHGIQA
ncbi:hypothetical protein [Teichococcus oryzae]|uniref:Uncharacterized protein n=1 Tax=Teichococcus oryzae TaxID=1608942 RepID=A0A5B2TD65_9PROT|nr:hypothetical protein [Pseudoroseomonas oryzae]KAA2212447.1 hypothetical protein F0Q34_14000 [Pseudoroseomonas oryzae]